MSRFSRRQTLGFGLGAGLTVSMAAAGDEARAAAPDAAFTLLLVNDIYKMSDTAGRGGFARLAAIVKMERARGRPMLYCHAGDTFSPSLMSGFDGGAHIVQLTNMAPPDVFVPGNHEFDFGKDVYLRRMGEARFPFYAANLRQADGSPVPGMHDSRIFALGPVRVGVVGLAFEPTPKVSQPGDLRFLPEVETLREQAAALRREGADLLVAVAHTDRAVDTEIVRSRLVDVLLTGHDHDLAIGYDGRTVMVESSEEGNFVTAIDFAVQVEGEGATRKVRWSPSFRVHDSATVEPDPEVAEAVRRLEADLSRELDVEIGTTATDLDSRSTVLRSGEAALGNLVADALRASTGADVALVNGGGFRAGRLYPAGHRLTRRDILAEMPFGNTTVLVEMTGAQVRAALENGVSQVEQRAGRFPQVSGLRMQVEPRLPAFARVVEVEVGGQPLDEARRYKVATNNFLLAGGDDYVQFAQGRVLIGATDGKYVSNETMAYIRRQGTVAARVEGRITLR